MAADHNPNAGEPNRATQPARGGFRWLILPAILIGAIGALAVVGNFALLAYRIFGSNAIAWDDVPWSFRIWELELRMVAMLAGGLLLAAALMLARGRWKIGLILAILGSLLAIANPGINRALRSYFAGDSYLIEAPAVNRRS